MTVKLISMLSSLFLTKRFIPKDLLSQQVTAFSVISFQKLLHAVY